MDYDRRILYKNEHTLTALKNGQYEKVQQELEEGRDLISGRQKVIKLGDKSYNFDPFVHLPGYRTISSGITTQIIEAATKSTVVVASQDIGQSSVRNNQYEISFSFGSLPCKDDQIIFFKES